MNKIKKVGYSVKSATSFMAIIPLRILAYIFWVFAFVLSLFRFPILFVVFMLWGMAAGYVRDVDSHIELGSYFRYTVATFGDYIHAGTIWKFLLICAGCALVLSFLVQKFKRGTFFLWYDNLMAASINKGTAMDYYNRKIKEIEKNEKRENAAKKSGKRTDTQGKIYDFKKSSNYIER
jgi:hypothetical protein